MHLWYDFYKIKLQNLMENSNNRSNILFIVSATSSVGQLPIPLALTPGDECDRVCVSTAKPLVCHFKWTLEHYHTMGT